MAACSRRTTSWKYCGDRPPHIRCTGAVMAAKSSGGSSSCIAAMSSRVRVGSMRRAIFPSGVATRPAKVKVRNHSGTWDSTAED